MKFVAIILLLLTSIFLIACSANQASNKISNSELENLASKYGGVYIFNQKFVEEIEKREAERKELSKKMKGRDLGDGLYAIDPKPINEKLPRILSNGKKYYTRWTVYERETGKKSIVPEIYINKIKEFIGMQDYNKHKPYIDLIKFYIESDGSIVPIVMTVDYYVKKKNYGLYGDEGRGFSLSQTTLKNISGDNKFILNNNKFEKVK
ncbi:tRNA 2-selenouridine synthase [Campylobacter concisus]|uniref:tRNA 2-selenouridine synthase n=1 Tax=Campylobacter concisus TaxID=199 RepID=UPI000CD85B4C|nr:tRNA 2-selenouridine synthase [Campylobacter concisus]